MVSLRRFSTLASFASAAAFVGALTGVLAACGSSTTYTPQVYIKASIGPGNTAATSSCGFAAGTDWLDIGTSDGVEYSPVPSGSNLGGATVNVDCRVTPSGDGFDVDITTSKTGEDTGGSLSISGHFTSSGVQSKITGTFGQQIKGTFTAADCTVTYENQYMGVAAGRVWGVLDCPDANYASQMRTCDAQAEFRFENCGQ